MAKKFDESKLRPKQREVALALVEREFAPKDERRTKEEIANEYEISRMSLHRWETGDSNFIAYKNHLADQFMDSHLSEVYKKLLEGITNGSMKGIELYLKRIGKLDSKTEITLDDKRSGESLEERKAALLERLKGDLNEN